MIWALLIGLVVGSIAKLLMPGRDPGGLFMTMLLGIAGSLLAGWFGITMNIYLPDEGPGFVASILGSMLVLAGYRALIGSSTVPQ